MHHVLGVGLIGSFFYLRNWLLHKNPFFPKFGNVFGYGYWGEWRSFAYEFTLEDYGQGRHILDFFPLAFSHVYNHGYAVWISRITRTEYRNFICHFIVLFSRNSTFLLCWGVIWALQVQQIGIFCSTIPIMIAYGVAKVPKETPLDSWFCICILVAFSNKTTLGPPTGNKILDNAQQRQRILGTTTPPKLSH